MRRRLIATEAAISTAESHASGRARVRMTCLFPARGNIVLGSSESNDIHN